MLSAQDNRLMSEVAPGTPMSTVFKGFWQPVIRAEALEAGGAPMKVRFCGENYVAFRTHDGRVGLFDERCPHRRCSLVIAANKDQALTCLFHGWKFDVSGKCVETPNEADPNFPAKVPLHSYDVREAGGAIWAYFGGGEAPRFPDYIFNHLPDDRVMPRVALVNFNWLTGIEAILDPSHVGLLHRDWIGEGPAKGTESKDIQFMSKNLVPQIDIDPTGYGFRYAAARPMSDGSTYVRVTEYMFPNGCFIANIPKTRKVFIISVPVDDAHSAQWYFWHSPGEPIPEHERAYMIGKTDPDPNDFYASVKGKPNWGQDRDRMKRDESFSGFTDIMFEDMIVGEAQGAIPDRDHEYLGKSDIAIIQARRRVLDAVRRVQNGEAVGHTNDFAYKAVQAVAMNVPNGTPWRDEATRLALERAVEFGIEIDHAPSVTEAA